MKEKLVQAKTSVTTITKNTVEFIQAVSLVILAGYAGYAVKQGKVTGAIAYIIAGAAAVVAVMGMWQLVKHFNKA